ncbi:PH domain-containing protein [Halobaculum sp. EA56]|uniref:PH domain-containing protein n=1 Tax=Halobaculum sp. EA56 TaxID=3421648 RepID=UPI003EBB3B22
MARLHPTSAALSALRSGGQLALFALFASTAFLGVGAPDGGSPAVLLVPAAFLVGAGLAAARWYRFEYEVVDDRLVVRSGVLSRQEREIPLRRIQNVDVRRSLLQRALGLATVTVETAGGGSTEATLDAVGGDEADRLRDRLGGQGAGEGGDAEGRGDEPAVTGTSTGTGRDADAEDAPGTGPAAEASTGARRPDRETLYALSGREFAVLCAVSFRPGAVLAPFVGASLFDDLIFDGGRLLVRWGVIDVDLGPGDVPTLGAGELLPLVALGVAAFLLVVWVVSALLTFVRYYGFRLERVGDELRYERGLLGRYSGNVPLSKVQTITVSENAAMRRLGYAGLTVDTAGATPGSNGDGGGSETAVPLDTRGRVVALADDLREELERGVDAPAGRAGGDPADDGAARPPSADDGGPRAANAARGDAFGRDAVERPPARARRRYVARYALTALAVTALAVGVDRFLVGLPGYLPLAPLVGVALAPPAGHLTWANRGHATVGDGFVTRTGVLRRHTRLVPYFRLQTVFVSRSVFQRRRDLASVTADSASTSRLLGGDATAHDLDAGDAEDLRGELLERLRESLAARRRGRRRREADRRGPAGDGRNGAADAPAEGDPEARRTTDADADPDADTRPFDWVDAGGDDAEESRGG